MKKVSLYMEKEGAGNEYRNGYLKEILGLVSSGKERADRERRKYFSPSLASVAAYKADIEKFRAEYRRTLGIPYFEGMESPKEAVYREEVAEDSLGKIYRVKVPVVPGLHLYGILIVSDCEKKLPMVLFPHGGNGKPEQVCGFYSNDTYHEMLRRYLLRGVSIFAPQLLLWVTGKDGEPHNRYLVDMNLKQLGTSIAGLEVFALTKAIDWLEKEPYVDPARIGMAGLSYGGYYTMLTAAADTRIKSAYMSGAYKDSFLHNELDSATDMTFEGAAFKFLDNEFFKLICPRALFAELASDDIYFKAADAEIRSHEVADTYRALGIENQFRYRTFTGVHEFPLDDEGLDFMLERL
jgi:dienelactone hydrolase